jgi:predicted naringenin-chalcone synthase
MDFMPLKLSEPSTSTSTRDKIFIHPGMASHTTILQKLLVSSQLHKQVIGTIITATTTKSYRKRWPPRVTSTQTHSKK